MDSCVDDSARTKAVSSVTQLNDCLVPPVSLIALGRISGT